MLKSTRREVGKKTHDVRRTPLRHSTLRHTHKSMRTQKNSLKKKNLFLSFNVHERHESISVRVLSQRSLKEKLEGDRESQRGEANLCTYMSLFALPDRYNCYLSLSLSLSQYRGWLIKVTMAMGDCAMSFTESACTALVVHTLTHNKITRIKRNSSANCN